MVSLSSGVPTILIVHPTKSYDRYASAKRGIQATLQHCTPALPLFVGDSHSRLYFDAPRLMQDNDVIPGSGMLLEPRFFKARKMWFDTDTYVFLGGRVARCLSNAFFSVLVHKLYDPSSIDDRTGIKALSSPGRSELLRSLPERKAGAPLNFHFNFEGIYPSTWDFRFIISKDPTETYFSPNILHAMLCATMNQNRMSLHTSGWDIVDYVNGQQMHSAVSVNTRGNQRRVHLFYWTSTQQMAQALKQASTN